MGHYRMKKQQFDMVQEEIEEEEAYEKNSAA
jgi:hypothetical protein